MSDSQHIPGLLKLASDPNQLIAAQNVAAQRLLAYDGEIYPHDGCAITLSVMLQDVAIDVQDTFQALAFGKMLETERNWKRIAIGQQQPGDIGSTCGTKPHHGFDHVYLVLKVNNPDEMIIADNQAQQPHFRYVSGQGGKTPTTFFLRAPQ